MAWVKVKRVRITNDEPVVTLRSNKFFFNTILVKLAELEKYPFVRLFVDDDYRKIGFEFTKEQEDSDIFRVMRDEDRNKDYACTSSEVLSRNWVRKVAETASINACPAKKEGKLWSISLIPAFEYSVKRDDITKITNELSGIYRYINQNDEIVYIGKGNIRNRFNEKNRETWIFDKVEYSAITGDDKALEWESFWIESYKESHNGELPRYNLINGRTLSE
jgi:hypothetical protein